MAGSVARVRPRADLGAVAVAVVVGVGPGGVGAAGLLVEIAKAVAVAVLARVGDAIAVRVLQAGMEDRPEIAPVPQAVGVGVLQVVADAIPIGVLGMGPRPGRVFLQVGQTIVVEVLGAVRDPVAIGVPARGVGLRPVPFVGIRQAVAIGVGGGCRGRTGAPRGRRHDERRQRDQAVGDAGPRHIGRVGQRRDPGPLIQGPDRSGRLARFRGAPVPARRAARRSAEGYARPAAASIAFAPALTNEPSEPSPMNRKPSSWWRASAVVS